MTQERYYIFGLIWDNNWNTPMDSVGPFTDLAEALLRANEIFTYENVEHENNNWYKNGVETWVVDFKGNRIL